MPNDLCRMGLRARSEKISANIWPKPAKVFAQRISHHTHGAKSLKFPFLNPHSRRPGLSAADFCVRHRAILPLLRDPAGLPPHTTRPLSIEPFPLPRCSPLTTRRHHHRHGVCRADPEGDRVQSAAVGRCPVPAVCRADPGGDGEDCAGGGEALPVGAAAHGVQPRRRPRLPRREVFSVGFKASGVICSGTNLDASRFLFFINEPPVINTQGVQESQPTTASLQPRTSFYVVPPQPPQSVQ